VTVKNVPFGLEGIKDTSVLRALAAVARHLFVPVSLRDQAYENRPLPIGYKQTISQPFVVAYMTEVLELEPHHRVLEIGTGSGYQAAVLSQLVKEVFTVEIIETLGMEAQVRLRAQGYDNVHVRIGNGRDGWPEFAPYDRIIVTAAAKRIPETLIGQLVSGGKLVIPVGLPEAVQSLILAEKTGEGNITTERLLAVRFVPMTGE
jgi:protein-L-isoaspartate(D-aspartate) O-methyltransferase